MAEEADDRPELMRPGPPPAPPSLGRVPGLGPLGAPSDLSVEINSCTNTIHQSLSTPLYTTKFLTKAYIITVKNQQVPWNKSPTLITC